MRAWWIELVLAGCFAHAQQAMPVGITRGSLLSSTSGLLEVRRVDGSVCECSYDAHTLFQRNQWPIQARDLNSGEPVEVLSDRRPGTRACYTRMLSVVHAAPAPMRRATQAAANPNLLGFTPHGYLTFAGVVIRSDASSFTLRSRAGERTLLLRADTKFSADGVRLDSPEELVNKHVFVRGGRNLYGGLEAYQVMWGEIFSAP